MSKAAGDSRDRLARVQERLAAVVAREGFELIEVELANEHGHAILRLYIDTVPPGTKERGVTVDDCQHVSRTAGDILDVEELMDGEYHLEVSSPGLFRPLTKPAHFEKAVGERVKVKTFEKIDGRKAFTGILKAHREGALVIEVDGTERMIPLERVAKANLEPLL